MENFIEVTKVCPNSDPDYVGVLEIKKMLIRKDLINCVYELNLEEAARHRGQCVLNLIDENNKINIMIVSEDFYTIKKMLAPKPIIETS